MKQFTSVVARLTQWISNRDHFEIDVVAANVCWLQPVGARKGVPYGSDDSVEDWPERVRIVFVGGNGVMVVGSLDEVKAALHLNT